MKYHYKIPDGRTAVVAWNKQPYDNAKRTDVGVDSAFTNPPVNSDVVAVKPTKDASGGVESVHTSDKLTRRWPHFDHGYHPLVIRNKSTGEVGRDAVHLGSSTTTIKTGDVCAHYLVAKGPCEVEVEYAWT